MTEQEAILVRMCRDMIDAAEHPNLVALAERWIDETVGWQ